ncbi:MAG: D-2-hydroxyacid dehydrogenase [Cellvibrionaceae bacterium]|nr:D-2-hydroxyacid dehydrogenase [Cellvibrionaceae bacterium]
MLNAVILDEDSLGPGDLDLSQLLGHCGHWRRYPSTTSKQTLERCQQAQLVVSNKVILDDSILAACPELKLILIAATGTNNIDLKAAASRGIAVCNVPGYGVASVAQHCWALILALATNLKAYDRDARNGRWSASPFFCLLDHPVLELQGKKLGIVGYGAIGQAVANIGRSFGMEILVSARPGSAADGGRLPFRQVLSQADVLSLHCPLTPDTENLIGAAELATMKTGALLLNCARGGLVDEAALIEALRGGHLGGAGLDTLCQEPPPAELPILAEDIPRLLLSPHSAWASREARQRLVNIMAGNLEAFLAGSRLNRVD